MPKGSSAGKNTFEDVLKSFAAALQANFKLPGRASPEDQLKAPMTDLLAKCGGLVGPAVQSKTEVHLSEHKVRPDIAAYADGLICGYIELKKPGLGADAPKLKGKHNKEQWKKLRNLPNLIYTDGREWALYRNGERIGGIVRFSDDPTDVGGKAVNGPDAERFEALIQDFLLWKPIVPHKPRALAKFIAPLARFLRTEVEHALAQSGSNVELLAREWRQFFFPDADDAQFADAYAQTVTYAMLLARLQGATSLSPVDAAKTLDANNGLLARALELLGQSGARDELRGGFELLQRALEALDPAEFLKGKPDLWLYFYEDFLAAYDPKLRKDYGVYYTPREVVELQVRLASELLETHFGKKLGFADDGVVFLDPAVGTGTYLVAAVKHALEKVRARSGKGAVSARAEQMAKNMYAFEILVGPYAVAHLRLTQALESEGAQLKDRLKIYLADTLESPNAKPPGGLTLTYKALTQEHEAARKIKQGGDILVCLGNPPYGRQTIEEGDTTTQRKGGWVRYGDQIKGGSKQEAQGERAILSDFTEPASATGAGIHLKNLYNDYVYFWRWALWRLFEQQTGGGIITFITASSYLGGPGFIGMREVMRREFDEIYIINLGGDNIGTRKTPNVFNIQTPVAILMGFRSKNPSRNTPAKTYYARIEADTRDKKLKILESIGSFSDVSWTKLDSAWHSPFYPKTDNKYFSWPELADLLPWQHSGAQYKRTWTIAEDKELLLERWKRLTSEPNDAAAAKLFKKTGSRDLKKSVTDEHGNKAKPIEKISNAEFEELVGRYAYRQFDRQWAVLDTRFADRFRPDLARVVGDQQIFFNTMVSKMLGGGAAMGVSAAYPDLHIFCGRGGKDIIPLYRGSDTIEANVTAGLLDLLTSVYGFQVSAEDLIAYVYALLGGKSYTVRFWDELETPGPRVPITKEGSRFSKAAALGSHLIWLHTYAERFQGKGRGNEVPSGAAKCINAVPGGPSKYPESFKYDPIAQEVHIGEGRFCPVAPEIWKFEVSGLKVVQSWLGYRMKVRAGKKSSPLDDIRPECWTPRMTDEFLELIWVLEATLAMEPDLSAALDAVVAGICFKASDLPEPTDEMRKAPKQGGEDGNQHSLF